MNSAITAVNILQRMNNSSGESFFQSLPDTVSSSFKTKLQNFIDAIPQWSTHIIDFSSNNLNTEDNTLSWWKGRCAKMTLNVGQWNPYSDLETFGGAGSYIGSGITPSALTTYGVTASNFGVGVFLKEHNTNNTPLWGVIEVDTTKQYLLSETAGVSLTARANTSSTMTNVAELGYTNDTFYAVDRSATTVQNLIKNAAILQTGTVVNGALATIPIDIFGRNNSGVHTLPAAGRIKATVVYLPVVDGVPFDYATFYSALTTLITAVEAEVPIIPVMVKRGQSNDVGRAEVNRLASAVLNPDGYTSTVKAFEIYYKAAYNAVDNGSWTDYIAGTNSVEPFNEAAINCFGSELSMAKKLYDRCHIARVIKVGYGGSSLAPSVPDQDWDPANPSELFVQARDGYENPALTKLGTEFPNKTIKPILDWHQGENDEATGGSAVTNYGSNLAAFVTAWRAINALYATAPLFITLLDFTRSANEKLVNEAIVTYVNATANTYLVNCRTNPTAYLATLSVQPDAEKLVNVTVTYSRKVDLPADIKSAYPPTATDDNHNSEEFHLKAGVAKFNKCISIGYL